MDGSRGGIVISLVGLFTLGKQVHFRRYGKMKTNIMEQCIEGNETMKDKRVY